IVYQELQRINVAIRTEELRRNTTLQNTFQYAISNNKPLHFIGLVSDGGVHSSLEHLTAMIQYAHEAKVPKIYIHAFTDGRDTDPRSAMGYINYLQKSIANTNAAIASITGRYYAMDRDKRWERIQKAYDALTLGRG